jgi:hypothetical protein
MIWEMHLLAVNGSAAIFLAQGNVLQGARITVCHRAKIRIPVCFERSMLDEIAILVTTCVRTYDYFNS